MPDEKSVRSEPLGDRDEQVDQQNVGVDNELGGGEFPDPETSPDRDAGAPGPEMVGHREHGQGQFNEHQPDVGGPTDAEAGAD
ncbi:MAG TPA: hypothetical protein VEA78_11610 [Acidimicrobiales bacterium]|nr:hypothetical protein [Acidimicrobiales bacterium]